MLIFFLLNSKQNKILLIGLRFRMQHSAYQKENIMNGGFKAS